MKRLALCAALLLVCFAVAVYGYFSLKNGCEELIAVLESAAVSIREKKNKEAGEKLAKADRLWKEKQRSFNVFLDHDSLENLDSSLPALKKLLDSGNPDPAFEEIQKCIAALQNIVDEQKICVQNIL